MPFFAAPASFRLRQLALPAAGASLSRRSEFLSGLQAPLISQTVNATMATIVERAVLEGSHLNFGRLAACVSEAVLEVVFVALPGFLVAYTGMFDKNSQKFVAELNTMVFTPCLIFTKLASQLTSDKLIDLAIIPVFFVLQILVSWTVSQIVARLFGFGRRQRHKNFILAMGIFGNANSLPISLVLSLSQTIPGLLWDKIPGDNSNEVAARGILYLLIFQQLGQLLRWTWGYSVLLAPKESYDEDDEEDAQHARITEEGRYVDDPDDAESVESPLKPGRPIDSAFGSGSQTPRSLSSGDSLMDTSIIGATPTNGNSLSRSTSYMSRRRSVAVQGGPGEQDRRMSMPRITRFPSFFATPVNADSTTELPAWQARIHRVARNVENTTSTFSHNTWRRLPSPVQKTLAKLHDYNCRFWAGVWRQMNPPLWAMLAALVVASVPDLQRLLFTEGTLINNSVTSAIAQSGGVAVPLILTVLGANLARSALPADEDSATTPEEKSDERRLLIASLLSRMVLPILFVAPIICLVAKYVPISILDDPIFIVVCFLIAGAPSALQLAQICQINNVFMPVMSRLLLWSYVVAIFPSTLALVMLALEGLQLAK